MKEERVCPSCGKSALPVATRCPRCGYAFETRYDQPLPDDSSHTVLLTVVLLVGVIVALLAANALRHHGSSETPAATAIEGMPAPASDSAAKRDPAASKKARPQPAATPAPAPAPPARPAPAVAQATPAPAGVGAAGRGQHRYATTWINVRAARSNKARVLRVLKPGESVRVDSLDQGWYQVVTADQVQGYADRRLLSEAAPPINP